MHNATLEHDGNTAVLDLITCFGQSVRVPCQKTDAETFMLTYTGVSEISIAQGVVEEVFDTAVAINVAGQSFRALRVTTDEFAIGELAWITEHYQLFMENHPPTWMVSKAPIDDPRVLFVNVDCVDGGGNIMKRYRVCPFTGTWRVMSNASPD